MEHSDSRSRRFKKNYPLNVADANRQKHRTWFRTRVTSVESESPNITLTKNLKSGSQVDDDKGKLLSPKGEKPIKLKVKQIKQGSSEK